MEKRLYRSQKNRVILGVCGGLAEYFNTDPVLIRVIAVLVIVFTGGFPGLIAYFVMALIIPNEGSVTSNPGDSFRENLSDIKNRSEQMGEDIRTTFSSKGTQAGPTVDPHPVVTPPPSRSTNSGLFLVAIIIIALGVFFLLENFFGWFWTRFWPVWLVIAGVIILIVVVTHKRN